MTADKREERGYFDCKERDEVTYVSVHFKDSEKVEQFLYKADEDGALENFTCEEIFNLLDANGFKRK